MRRLTLGLGLAVAVVLLEPRASAQPPAVDPPPPADDARTRAQPAFQEGLGLVQEQRWADALDAFLRARAIYESPILVFNVGYCQRALGQLVEARDTFRAFVALPLEGVAATRRGEAEDYLRELESRIARVIVRVPADLAGGSTAELDGRVLPLDASGSAERDVNPGSHTLAVRREGYVPFYEDRNVAPGARVEVAAVLRRLPARVVIASNVEAARVHLDGTAIGRVPFDGEVEPGRHRIEVRAEGYVPHRSTLNLVPGGTARVSADLAREPTPITARWWFWAGVGALVVGAATTTYLIANQPEPPPYDGGTLGWVVQPR